MLPCYEERPGVGLTPADSVPPEVSQPVQLCGAMQSTVPVKPTDSSSEPLLQPSPEVGQCSVSRQDIIIAVMGPTGAGKSSFISRATGQEDTTIGHGLHSCTRDVQAIRCRYPGGSDRNVVLVDTPGFDDTDITDADILKSIAQWLTKTYEQKITLTGLLYLHRITDNRMSGAPLRNFKMFKRLCGKESFQSILLATTMWDDMDECLGSQRVDELTNKYWKPMMKLGSRVVRFHNTRESAWDIIGQFTGVRQPLRLQKEMVDERKPLAETAAGLALYYWLEDFIAQIRQLIKSIRSRVRGVSKDEESPPTFSTEEGEAGVLRQLKQATEQRDKLHGRTEQGRFFNAVKTAINQASSPSSFSTPLDSRSSLSLHDTTLSRSETLCSVSSTDEDTDPLDGCGSRLAATITALKHAKDIADMAPVPGLKGAASLALTIAESIESMQKTQDTLIIVASNAGRLVIAISEYARAGEMPDGIQQAVNDLIRELKLVQRVVKNVTSRSRRHVKHYILQPAEERLAIQCNERIQFACQIFEIKFALDIRQVLARVEERISRFQQ